MESLRAGGNLTKHIIQGVILNARLNIQLAFHIILFTEAYITVQIYSIHPKSMGWCEYERFRYFRRYSLAEGHGSQEMCL